MRYETQEARAPSSKEAVERKLEGYGHRGLKRVAAKLDQKGVEVGEISQNTVARAIAEMDDTAAEDDELVAALGQLKLQEIEARYGGDG